MLHSSVEMKKTLKRILMPKNDIQKKLMVLQGEMMEATLKGDKDQYAKFNNEYNLLTDQLAGLLFGKREKFL